MPPPLRGHFATLQVYFVQKTSFFWTNKSLLFANTFHSKRKHSILGFSCRIPKALNQHVWSFALHFRTKNYVCLLARKWDFLIFLHFRYSPQKGWRNAIFFNRNHTFFCTRFSESAFVVLGGVDNLFCWKNISHLCNLKNGTEQKSMLLLPNVYFLLLASKWSVLSQITFLKVVHFSFICLTAT